MWKIEMIMYRYIGHHKEYDIKLLIISTCIASRSDMIVIDIWIIKLICEEQGLVEVKMLQKH